MNKLISIALLGILINTQIFGQRSPLEKRLKAEIVDDFVLLNYRPNSNAIQYENDPKKQRPSKQHLTTNNSPLEFVAKKDYVNIVLAFINPLKYSINIETEYEQDYIYVGINQFTNSVETLLQQTVSKDIAIKESKTELGLKAKIDILKDNTSNINKFISGTTETDKKWALMGINPIWYAWYLEVDKLKSDLTISSNGGDNFNNFLLTVAGLSTTVLDSLYDNPKLETKKIDKITTQYNRLKGRDNYDDFVTEIKLLRNITQKQKSNIENVRAIVSDLEKKITSYSDKIAATGTTTSDILSRKVFYYYTKSVFNDFKTKINEELDNQTELVTSIQSVLLEIDKLRENYDASLDAYKLGQVQILPKQTTRVKVSVALKNSVNTNEITSANIRISEYSLFVPELSVGANFTNIQTPAYGIAFDSASKGFVVKQSKNTISNASAMTMLNLLPVIPRSNFYPMLQLGAGLLLNNNTLTPVLGAGFGYRLFQPTNLSISFGFLWHWNKELNQLKDGSLVKSSEELNSDLTYKFISTPDFYLGINYHFPN